MSSYGATQGLPALRDALLEKLKTKNGLTNYDVMVTAGANQAFVNVVLALCDDTDRVCLFKPYYFNHLMAFQMTGGAQQVVLGPCDPGTLHPDLAWLKAELEGPTPPKMVVVVNPCNPTGVMLSQGEVQSLADMCAAAGSWLVLDNTYEDFCWEGRTHSCVGGPHVLHVFSFSKAYGMMGWRVGYVAVPSGGPAGSRTMAQLLKVQDTVPICPTQLSQHIALAALQSGEDYMRQQIRGLEGNRAAILDALSPLGKLGDGIAGGEGAIYLWARLPAGCDDELTQEWLVKKHGVCVIPGAPCGAPGYVRVSFANLPADKCLMAASRLKAGMTELAAKGAVILSEPL